MNSGQKDSRLARLTLMTNYLDTQLAALYAANQSRNVAVLDELTPFQLDEISIEHKV